MGEYNMEGLTGKLTNRQWKVLRLFVSGISLREIAAECDISLPSLYGYLHRIYKKLNTVSFPLLKEWVEKHDANIT